MVMNVYVHMFADLPNKLFQILLMSLKKTRAGSSGASAKGGSADVLAEDITFLNINQPISCLCAGPMSRNSDRSFLFVGTASNVFGYDVENNKDLFYKEVAYLYAGWFKSIRLATGIYL